MMAEKQITWLVSAYMTANENQERQNQQVLILWMGQIKYFQPKLSARSHG